MWKPKSCLTGGKWGGCGVSLEIGVYMHTLPHVTEKGPLRFAAQGNLHALMTYLGQ